jgi:hypothetical protein
MTRTEIYKKTTDNWYPNYNIDEVKLIYNGKLRDGKFRVSCWGNDDFGIDKDFEDETESIKVFEQLKAKEIINHQDLYNLGFTKF